MTPEGFAQQFAKLRRAAALVGMRAEEAYTYKDRMRRGGWYSLLDADGSYRYSTDEPDQARAWLICNT